VNFVKLQISAAPTQFSKEVTSREVFPEPAIHSAYLPPNSQSMQKTYRGRSLLALSTTKGMLKIAASNKGAIDCREHNTQQPTK
jgi:hypothetical protein